MMRSTRVRLTSTIEALAACVAAGCLAQGCSRPMVFRGSEVRDVDIRYGAG